MSITTPTEAVNMALDHLGEAVVATPYTGNTDVASEAAVRHFANTRDTVLRDHTWAFATRIEELVASADAADTDWTYKYDLPTGCLKVISIINALGRTAEDEEFILRHTVADDAEVLLTDTETPTIKFMYQEDDVALWEANFIEAFSYRLAANLCFPVTQNAGLKQGLLQLYQWSVNKAKQIDSSQGRVDVMQIAHQDFITARD